jgi:hypothetical protein
MPSKIFKGVDFDDKGNIVTRPGTWESGIYHYQPTVFKYLEPKPVAYRANELDKMSDSDFTHLHKWVGREELRRSLVAKQKVLHSQEAYDGLSNFLAGCVQAMACRAALRWGRGHRPFSPDGQGPGSKPTSGEMWNIFDVAALGDRLLASSTDSAVHYGDFEYSVNANPMLWNMTHTTAKRWLQKTQFMTWPNGSKFCCWRTTNPERA